MDRSLQAGSNSLMLLKLIAEQDMYGYQIIDTLEKRSDRTFSLKAGTLYPLLKGMEEKGQIASYEKESPEGRMRKYYRITPVGKKQLRAKTEEWNRFVGAVNGVLGGELFANA